MKKVTRNGKMPPDMPPHVEAAFLSYPSTVRAKLLRLRRIVRDTAAKMDGVVLEETLKWGQPAYLCRGGSTIRIDRARDDSSRIALYFICQTDLIATFRELYPALEYSGNRAILLDCRASIPEDALRHCISLALAYRRRSG
jgi:hypothetical protein